MIARRYTICVEGGLSNSVFTVLRIAPGVIFDASSCTTAEMSMVKYDVSVIGCDVGGR